MRFHADGPSIPDILLHRCDAGRVVFLCGAGVSMPSGMPDFVELTQHVIDFFSPPANSEIRVAFQPWLNNRSAANVPLDQIFNLLHIEYGKDEVNALVTKRLSASASKPVGREHALLKRISSSSRGAPQIVTTNFDRLFEETADEMPLKLHEPPGFPDLKFDSKIEGITYLHGRLAGVEAESHSYILSSADFGRAYLSEGWATSFIRQLLDRYTVVLVGYKAEDPPVKYLLQGLNHDGQFDRSRLYAFDLGNADEIEAKWRDRGVTAIAFSSYEKFWSSIEAWADRADDPRKWRAAVIAMSQQDPKDLHPHERGQVAHILRTVQGARAFAEAKPAPHPEWVCVMDASIRSGRPNTDARSDGASFDPRVAYGLDDDHRDITETDRQQGISNEDLLIWRNDDDSPNDIHRLRGLLPGGVGATPRRLDHLISWLSRQIESPVVAWWVIRQNGLHPRLLQQLNFQVRHSVALPKQALHVWDLILESRQSSSGPWQESGWFDLMSRLQADGWTARILRDLRRVTTPRLEITPRRGPDQFKLPNAIWQEIHLRDLGLCTVSFTAPPAKIRDIPDSVLPKVFSILEDQLAFASGLLDDIETMYFRTPTCYPRREIDGEPHIQGAAKLVPWFIQLFDRMAATWPDLAHAHATTWPTTDPFYFRKLKLYAFSKVEVFDAADVAKAVLSLNQDEFWDINVTREILFLLTDRWKDFPKANQEQLIDRILKGPDQHPQCPDKDYPMRRNDLAARYARYIEMQGCDFPDDARNRLASMIMSNASWNDSWATSTVVEHGTHLGWVGTDETPDELLTLPVNEIITKANEDLRRGFGSLTEKRSFVGLVKVNPRKALAALTVTEKKGRHDVERWSDMIAALPDNISPRLRRAFLSRVARLPAWVVAELNHTLCRWIEKNLVATLDFDEKLGLLVFDHIAESLLKSEPNATKSGLAGFSQGAEIIQQSRRTFDHAINGPIGMCVNALIHAVPGDNRSAGSLIPQHIRHRIERLFSAPGEGSDHAVSIACQQLNWFMFIDPAWTKELLIPLLTLDHPASEPAWNGFLNSTQAPSPDLTAIIKPILVNLFPKIEEFVLDHDLLEVAAVWLGSMRVFHPNEQIGLSSIEMRSALRSMSDETRNRFIFTLGQLGQASQNGWSQYVIPLINEDWPRDRRYRTSASTRAWIGMLDDTGEYFPAVYEAVKRFLTPTELNDGPFYNFTREYSDEAPLATQHPETALDLINRVTPSVVPRDSYQLREVLALIADVRPDLTSDSRYLRLIDLIEQS